MCCSPSQRDEFLRVDAACTSPSFPEVTAGSAAGPVSLRPGEAGADTGRERPAERLNLGLITQRECQD